MPEILKFHAEFTVSKKENSLKKHKLLEVCALYTG